MAGNDMERMLRPTRAAWDLGIEREIEWWQGYLETGGYSSPETRAEFRLRFDPSAPLQAHIARLLPIDVPTVEVQILDCAAGPATTLGKTVNGRRHSIRAIDALAEHYRQILDSLDLVPPVPSLTCHAEALDSMFEEEQFHMVYMRFALDHCYDPIEALSQMLRVTHRGGIILVEHYREEGEIEYQGLRQWSLHPETDDLVIANARHRFSVRGKFPDVQLKLDVGPSRFSMHLYRSVE